MKKQLSALICLATIMGMSACGPEGATNKTPPKATASATETEESAEPEQLTTTPLSISYTCGVYDANGKAIQYKSSDGATMLNRYVNFSSYEDAWNYDGLTNCEGKYRYGDLSDTDEQAVKTAGYTDSKSVGTLYGICATTIGYPIDNKTRDGDPNPDGNPLINAVQGNEALGALVICPDHPSADKIKQNAAEAGAQDAWLQSKKDAGEVLADGTYAIGQQMAPGTWQTSTQQVSDCYWELRDANGATIDNDFVVGAPSVTVQVPDTATSFTSKGCGTWIKQ